MQHLTEEEIVAQYYRDGDNEEAATHLASCDECRRELETLQGVLALVDTLSIPERDETYANEVWTRLRWKLGSERRRSTWSTIAAIAAALAIAFVGGILWHARTQPSQQPASMTARAAAPAAAPPVSLESGNRLLLVVVSDHLDSSERMLLELSNADPKHSLDVSSESKRAGELVASNRIYRQTATRRGETRIASLLSDLEPVLVELSHAGSTLSPDEVAALQKRIDSKGLLFKVRVVSAQAGGHEGPANAQPKGMDSL
jgi:hypothetical protein